MNFEDTAEAEHPLEKPTVDHAPEIDNVHEAPVKNRVFLNHVDQYNARHITEYLTDQTMGSFKEVGNEALGEGEGEEEPKVDLHPVPENTEKYECIGTLKYRFGRQTEDIAYTVSEADQKVLDKEILNAGFVIYDISHDPGEIPKALNALNVLIQEIESVKEIGPKTFQRFDRNFVFILISNILTWGKTKPIVRDDPEVPFTEADYKKRKACPNYKEQIACEREVVLKGRKYKDVLKTYVVCCGIPYGFDEDILFPFFKLAWESKDLPILLPGTNYIPLIHIQDVAKVIHAILELQPKKQYILAVEQMPSRLGRIMRALSRAMGKGVKEIPKEEAFLYNSINQNLYDILTLNLKMEPAFILDELGLEYKSDLSMVQNMHKIAMEFRVARNVIPMKIVVHGPVACGKTSLANHLVEYYGVHYVNVRTMIDETRENLKDRINAELELRKTKLQDQGDQADDEVGEEGNEEDDYEPVVDVASLENKLKTLETTLENNDNMLPDDSVARLMKQFLASNLCQNQGYVLDGYPKTIKQCKDLFGAELDGGNFGGEGAGDEEEEELSPGRSTVPQFIVSLEASDEYLIDIMMNYPETNDRVYDEENMIKRLKFFRENNTEDNTMLNYFDEHEIHPFIINMMNLISFDTLFEKIHDKFGPPFGFEPTPEEQEEILRCQEGAANLRAELDANEKEILEREALEAYEAKMEERLRTQNELQKEEEKFLAVQCEPLRHYIMMRIFPTLTNGLLEIARTKPRDPVDYLAEYLFKNNPEGKMFDPTYTHRRESLQDEQRDSFVKKTTNKKLEDAC